MRLEERLARAARSAGAAGFGICTADPFPEVRSELERRKDDGTHADLTFTYNHPRRSTDVRESLPWAERLAVVAWPYLPAAGTPGTPQAGTGRIARFATEDHYVGLRATLAEVANVYTWTATEGTVLLTSATDAPATPGEGSSSWPTLSSDGSLVAFQSQVGTDAPSIELIERSDGSRRIDPFYSA